VSSSPGRDLSGLPSPDKQAREHAARVYQQICRRIDADGGWISFSIFMDLALHAPGLGYYAAGSRKFGSAGDFVTAPEMTPLFGQALAHQVAQILELTNGEILELGAGSGVLAVDMLNELDRLGVAPARYRILEPSPELGERQRQRMRSLPMKLRGLVDWADTLPQRFTGVVVANEVLDAIPVQVVHWRDDGLFERGVAVRDGALVWEERPAGAALRAACEGLQVAPPYVSEVAPAACDLVADLCRRVDRGALLLVDYGFPRAEYYHPQRSSGTLACHYRHHVHDQPFFLPGLQDITAHVDFTAIAEAGVDAGCRLAGYTSQAQFLLNCGMTDLLSRTPSEDTAAYLPQAASVQKLLSPAEMGELFKVLSLSRGIDVPLLGFATGDRSASL
jgi:SAM-dependent MidA family methyltransferase